MAEARICCTNRYVNGVWCVTKKSYEEWRFGKVSYLEKCCAVNLSKLLFVLHQMELYAKKQGWKPSFCFYKQWGVKKKSGQGHKPVVPLRFSKSGNAEIEKRYAAHFVDVVKQLKKTEYKEKANWFYFRNSE